MDVVRRRERLESDDRRVISRFLTFDRDRTRSIIRRVLLLPDEEVPPLLEQARARFAGRHPDLDGAFRENFTLAARHIEPPPELPADRLLLIGAYFTMEYSIEAAALFNPSIVPHPDQTGLPPGAVRFLMSLRATGEGHISSIVFRRGVLTEDVITFDPPPRYAYWARAIPCENFAKAEFARKLRRIDPDLQFAKAVLNRLPDPFPFDALAEAVREVSMSRGTPITFRKVAADILFIARAHYLLRFPADCLPAETVIFPATEQERRGMEDLRLVRFVEDDGSARYFGTYTAFDGTVVVPMLLETPDFRTFRISTLDGRYARNKGFALFPRKVGGRYLMVSRHDGECLYLLESDDLSFWDAATRIREPAEPWELVQIGNCGSPLETEEGWILLTHGVGPVRQYAIGAMLLDRADPSHVRGRLRQPLLIPTAEEREGYVPNVVYSCGSMIHGDRLFIPYAMADQATSFITVSVAELIDRLLADGP
ncbi:MAG: glycoside hydrolase family 130 protein [Planctomycetes bacterium]|nr:glycoside hydrolase family 130 protein [Planctomycetota bacterium]